MIDFRYHLVSLISVFLALAVGIVLGAGPLGDNLGTQLAEQVEQLRGEQEQLRTEADELQTRNDQLASYVSESGPELVADTLPGQSVALLTDGDSTRTATEQVTSLLEGAGVSAVVEIRLRSDLWDPAQEQRRAEAADEIRSIAPALLDPELEGPAQLAAIVPALLAEDPSGELTQELRTQVWQVLVDHQLIALTDGTPGVVEAVVYASAAPETFVLEGEAEDLAAERAQNLLSAQTAVLTSLAATSVPAVVSAATPANDSSTGILRTVRGDAGFDQLSTTDRLQEADGPILSVLALIEQVRGGAGAYGTTADAAERVPPLPAPTAPADSEGEGSAPSDGGNG
ncbi:copper transporter [Brachybacterium sp. J153]|uniref:copper transporter n=1 Tax=Brachybacterium sp. J153 TaxID=3116488 RepID=UPI002E7809DF|nr:copper transporter [Brachybacterium sp. J153]MEE1619760.1 copper transporter [Brachybacterium sp. J153]